MKTKQAKNFLQHLADCLTGCESCDATGIDPHDQESACRQCGGYGEYVAAFVDPGDLREILGMPERKSS